MDFHVEVEQEEDGRWIAEIAEIAGCMVYGTTEKTAISQARELALCVVGKLPLSPNTK
jgi:predicted RNase H-like HicB family nuclease